MPRRLLTLFAGATLVLIGCGSSSSPKASPASSSVSAAESASFSVSSLSSSSAGTSIEVTVKGGRVDGGVQTKDVALGDTVTLTVNSDVSDEVHVHGYDKKADVTAGSYASITFTADIPGQFEVELENAHLKIVELKVS